MKILLFWEQSEWGGVDSHLKELLMNWPNDEDEIHLVYNLGNEGFKRIKTSLALKKNIYFYEFNSFSYSGIVTHFNKSKLKILIRILLHFFKPFLFYINKHQIKKFFKKNFNFIDAILVNNGGYPASWGCLASIVVSKQINIKKRLLLVHHAAAKYSFFTSIFEKYLDKLVISSATNFIFVSNASKKSFIENRNFSKDNNKFLVIHNEYFLKTSKKNDNIKKKLNMITKRKDGEILIGMIGRIEKYKGHEDLIRGVSELNKMHLSKVKIIFIGEGNKKEIDRLNKIIKKLHLVNKVFFSGYLDYDSREIVKNLDLLMMLTRDFEGFGLTILEAIHSLTPFVSTDVGAVKEFVSNDIGTFIAANSPDQVKKAIIKFIEKNDLFIEKSMKAHELFSKKEITMHKKYRNLMIKYE